MPAAPPAPSPLPLYRLHVFFSIPLTSSLFLCQLVLSSWLSCLWRVPLCPLSLSPLFSDPLSLSLLPFVAFCFNIRSLPALRKLPHGFHASLLLSLCQLFPSVQENQEVKAAAVKSGSPGVESPLSSPLEVTGSVLN